MSESRKPIIHPSAIVHTTAILGDGVQIGPFCLVGPAVRIGARTNLLASVNIVESTHIGADCEIHPGAVLGGKPQSRDFKPQAPVVGKPLVVIGDKCVIREFVTIHQATEGPASPTRIGNNVYIMTNVHVAHDCVIEAGVTLVTGVGIAGHCTVMEGATVGGLSGIHQFVRVGRGAFVAAGSMLTHDALPYSMVQGNRARTKGLNVIGLQRQGCSEERIAHLLQAMNQYFKTGKVEPENVNADVKVMLDFIQGATRGISLPPDIESIPLIAKV